MNIDNIPSALKREREKNNVTQEQAAAKARISTNAIAKLETGVIKNPRIKTLIAIAMCFGVKVDDLLN